MLLVSLFLSGLIPCTDKLAARMELEFKRLQRRKLFASEEGSVSNPGSPVSSSGSGMGHGSSSKEQPIFTLKQVRYGGYVYASGGL